MMKYWPKFRVNRATGPGECEDRRENTIQFCIGQTGANVQLNVNIHGRTGQCRLSQVYAYEFAMKTTPPISVYIGIYWPEAKGKCSRSPGRDFYQGLTNTKHDYYVDSDILFLKARNVNSLHWSHRSGCVIFSDSINDWKRISDTEETRKRTAVVGVYIHISRMKHFLLDINRIIAYTGCYTWNLPYFARRFLTSI